MIRVAFLLDTFARGGTEMNALRLARGLDRTQVRLRIASLREEGPLRSEYDALGLSPIVFPFRGLGSPSFLIQGLRLVRWLRRERIELLHTHDVYTNIFGAAWGRLAGVPVIITSRRWGTESWRPPRLLAANRLAGRLGTAVLANSRAVASTLEAEGVARERIRIIHNFVEPDAFQPVTVAERSAWRRAANIPPQAVLIGCVARLWPIKDHETLIRAFARIPEPAEGLHLALIGGGPLLDSLISLADQQGVSSRVHFLGEVPNRPNPNAFFDIAALCSRSEGFPNVIVEAMAASRAVVATAVGGIPDAVRHEETGLLVPGGDCDAVAGALTRLVEHPELRAELGRTGQQVARTDYADAAVLAELGAWYAELLEPRSGRRHEAPAANP